MVTEIYPRMTSLIKNSKWRRDLLKGCIAIALLKVEHHNVRGCEAISGNFAVSGRNCLTSTLLLKYIAMQMRKVNCEKGLWESKLLLTSSQRFFSVYVTNYRRAFL